MIATTHRMDTSRQRRLSSSGFTSLEVLGAVALIGLLTGQIVPDLQRAREAANKAKCANNLKQIGLAAHNYNDTNRKLPDTLGDLLAAAGFGEGGFDGYTPSSYRVGPEGWSLVMNPVPGVTGSETAYATGAPDGTVRIQFVPAPGAAEGRARMMAQLRADAAAAIGQTICLRIAATNNQGLLAAQVIQYLMTPGVAIQTILPLVGPDGKISFASIRRGMITGLSDGSVRTVHTEVAGAVWSGVYDRAGLGAAGENWELLPAVAPPTDTAGALSLFTYAELTSLTQHFAAGVFDPATATWFLRNANSAAASGNRAGELAALTAYRDAVAAAAKPPVPVLSPLAADALDTLAQIVYR